MKHFINYIALLVLVLSFQSCDKKCYRELSIEEKSRLAYKGGEKIVFRSSSNQFDTLKITDNIETTVFAKENKCKNEQHKFQVYGTFNQKLYSQLTFISFLTEIDEPRYKYNDFIYPEIATNLGYFSLGKSTPITSININGKQLYNVYEIINSGSPLQSFSVDKIYFSFEYGLLKIVLHDGSYWERINY